MVNKIKKELRCENGDCKTIAEYECEECFTKYCNDCAEGMDYECDCIDLPRLVKLRRRKI